LVAALSGLGFDPGIFGVIQRFRGGNSTVARSKELDFERCPGYGVFHGIESVFTTALARRV
jgi:hypothetical protein